MREFFKRLFCKHNWLFVKDFEFFIGENTRIIICKKCHKTNVETFKPE